MSITHIRLRITPISGKYKGIIGNEKTIPAFPVKYLKEIGFSDDLIKAIVMNQDPSETDDRDMILRMFGNMGIMIKAEKNRHERYKRPRPR